MISGQICVLVLGSVMAPSSHKSVDLNIGHVSGRLLNTSTRNLKHSLVKVKVKGKKKMASSGDDKAKTIMIGE